MKYLKGALGLFMLGGLPLRAENCTALCPPLPPEEWTCRDRAIWEQPVCPCPSGINYDYPKEDNLIHIEPYGYIKWETYWNTRQIEGYRNGQEILFPLPQLLDPLGIDINSHGNWQMTAFETRLGIALYGPEWHGFITDGLIETDFRGISDDTIATLRMRHAFGRISWQNGSLLFGQWWHPLFVLECFPHTIAYNTGAPIEPHSRQPQLRLTHRWGRYEVICALAGQRDFASNGPIDVSTQYIMNSVTPNMSLQVRAYGNNDDTLFGVAGDYLRLVPRIESLTGYAVQESIGSFFFEAFAAWRYAPWSLRIKGYWAQNANDQVAISGFGVRTIEPITDQRTYSNTAAAGGWIDFSYLFGCDDRELGIFIGGVKNLGSRHRLYIDETTGQPIIYALTIYGPTIDYIWRVSPRFIFKKDPIRVGAEIETTRASFGPPNEFGRITQGVPVTNVRILLVIYYMF